MEVVVTTKSRLSFFNIMNPFAEKLLREKTEISVFHLFS